MYRAIVVDDEPFMREGMRLMIDWALCGFELAGEAGTAQEALHLVDQLRPDLVITDIRMPGLLGTDLAELLSRHYPDTMVLFFSGYRDFAYAKAAIHSHALGYLLKPIDSDEVQKALLNVKEALDQRRAQQREAVAPIIREHALRRLAFGDDSMEALMQCALLLNIDRNETVCCAVIELDGGDGKTRIEELWHAGGVSFVLSATMLGVMCRGDADRSSLSQCKADLARRPDVRAYIGVGNPGRGAEGFRESLRQAIDALGPWFMPEGELRRYHPYDQTAAQWMIDADVVSLETSLRRCQPDVFQRQLEHMERAYRQKRPGLFCLRAMAHGVELSLAGGNSADGSPIRALRELWRDERQTADMWMERFVQAMRAYAAQRFDAGSDMPETVSQVLRYIDESYADNASIGDISARLYMNPAYLGQLVRRHTGDTFHHHLLRVRMNQACRLLRQTSMTVADIASAVGIRNVDYFTVQFKKHTGLRPNDYRNGSVQAGVLS